MNSDCIFCNVARDPDKVIWENDDFAAFKDIHPEEPLHLLIVPKEHIQSFDQLDPATAPALVSAVQEVIKQQGVEGSYRLIMNTGHHYGHVDHLHVHLLAKG